MPNYSFNYIVVEGEEVLKFKEFAMPKKQVKEESEVIDFNNFIPYPEEEQRKELINYHAYRLKTLNKPFKKQTKEEYYAENKIDEQMKKEIMLCNLDDENYLLGFMGWHSLNWGTKWNACYSSVVLVDNTTLLYRFDTAWSPPLPVFSKMSELFPNLTFTMLYGEEGMFFSGYIRMKGNQILDDCHSKYKNNWNYPIMFMKKYKLTKLEKHIKGE